MEQRHSALIRESWKVVGPRGAGLADAFYQRLFELDPRLRDLFAATEMESQSDKFMTMLSEVVRIMEDPEKFEGVLEASGRRHAGYGVVARHYRTVGEALLWALDEALPGGMDAETREAWSEAYTRMAFIMQRAAA